MKDFQDLRAWQVAMDLVEEVYALTARFPDEEKYGLTSQLRRAAVSIVANIAEGFGRYSYAEKAQRYIVSRGECKEVQAELLVSVRVKHVQHSDIKRAFALATEVSRLLSGLITASRVQR